MAHFARVNNGIVEEVIVAEQDFIDNYKCPNPGTWIQTSYNTYGGKHKLGNNPLRYNYAGKGFHYDAEADAFYERKPYDSWVLNTNTYLWEAPVPLPSDMSNEILNSPDYRDGILYEWNETNKSWDKVE